MDKKGLISKLIYLGDVKPIALVMCIVVDIVSSWLL